MFAKFSLRAILLLVTAAAVLSPVIARAVAGDAWAIGVTAAFAWAAFALLLHALSYVLATMLGRLGEGRTQVHTAGADQADAAAEAAGE